MVPELTGATPPFWGSCVGACVCACVRVCVCPGKRGVLRACLCRFLLTHTPFHPSSRHTLQAEAAHPPPAADRSAATTLLAAVQEVQGLGWVGTVRPAARSARGGAWAAFTLQKRRLR